MNDMEDQQHHHWWSKTLRQGRKLGGAMIRYLIVDLLVERWKKFFENFDPTDLL